MGQPALRENGTMAGRNEGVCSVCQAPVSQHVKGGRWTGCRRGIVPPARLILVPDRRSPARKGSMALQIDRRRESSVQSAPIHRDGAQTSRLAYVALYRVSSEQVKVLQGKRDYLVFRAIARNRGGITAVELAEQMELDSTRGVVESSLQRLKAHGFISTIPARTEGR